MEGSVNNYIFKKEKENNNLISSNKAFLTSFSIIFLLFAIITILCITEGWGKMEEYVEYARGVEDANFTTVMGPVLFIGPSYVFVGTCIISIGIRFIRKNIDSRLKRILKMLPIFVILLTIPAWFLSVYIAQIIHLI